MSRKRSLGRPRRKWEVNIKMDLQGVGYGGIDCIDPVEDRNRTLWFHKMRVIP
jgi:hypothetical protein